MLPFPHCSLSQNRQKDNTEGVERRTLGGLEPNHTGLGDWTVHGAGLARANRE